MKLRARVLDREDLPHRVTWFNCESVCSQMPISKPITLESTLAWFEGNRANPRRLDFVFADADQPEQTLPLAMGGLVDIDPINQRAELYILTDPDMTGLGIGSQAVCWMCNYGFGPLRLHKLYLFTLAINNRARKFYERLGFVPEGILREHLFYRGQLTDRYIHSLFRRDWEKSGWREELSPLQTV